MGGKWSKRSTGGWNAVRERMRRAEPATDQADCAAEAQEEEEVGLSSQTSGAFKTTWLTKAAFACLASFWEDEKGGLEGLIWLPKKTMTYLASVGLSHTQGFLPWLAGLHYQGQGSDIPDLWMCFKLDQFPDRWNYRPMQGVRYQQTCVSPYKPAWDEHDPEKEAVAVEFDSSPSREMLPGMDYTERAV
uniref:Nef protein n=1 Tax=Human immunodeficiency virus type 1 TaxID=11676 RepID=A0A076V662_HV1|nr:nef protein [Human immunodeficiency virus 1]